MASLPKFDIFSGSREEDARWIETVEGLSEANERMQQLAVRKPGRYFIFYTAANTVVASIETFDTPHQPPKSRSTAA